MGKPKRKAESIPRRVEWKGEHDEFLNRLLDEDLKGTGNMRRMMDEFKKKYPSVADEPFLRSRIADIRVQR